MPKNNERGWTGSNNNSSKVLLNKRSPHIGMVALSSMAISFGGTTFSICGDRLFSKTFEELLLLPVHPLSLFL
ncbi:MAG: hypothetical protein ACKO90_43000, partial [Microcystis panniformis]